MANKIFAFVVITIIILGIVKITSDKKKLDEESRITIGVIFKYDYYRFRYWYYYSYSVSGVSYIHSIRSEEFKPSEVMNKRFYVSFYPDNPQNSEILINKPVPDTMNTVPLEGWLSIPTQ